MKKIGLMAAAALAGVFMMTSCDGASKLSENISGTWSGAPIHLIDNSASSASTIDTYTFTRDEKSNGGNLIVTSLISVTGSINGSGAIVQPFSLSAAATASIQGRWNVVDDDEISVSLELKTLQVNVDPSAVVLSAAMLNGSTMASVDSMKPALVNSIGAQLRQAVSNRYLGIKKIDDIEIKGSLMEWEINKSKETLSRQGPVEQ